MSGADGSWSTWRTYINAGVIEEKPIAGESHVFFLPLLVQRIAASFQQETLMGERR